ncbi:MAG: tetratricopeptide repeat protein [Candidatus Omnitrophica bacterium]|nr:tetratricopeptide repeat protein [Candidatus Omnitrophota bacterium]
MIRITEKKDFWAVLLLCAAVYGVYCNSISNVFVFDDKHMILLNNYIKKFSNIPLFFKGEITTHPIEKGMYRPVLMISFVFNYLLAGLKPYGYHLFNILIHFLNTFFLYLLLKLLFKDGSWLVRLGLSLIFAVHPINTEAVTYISSRSTILCSFFMISGVYAYTRWLISRKKYLYPLSVLLYILALLTKEIGLIFPVLLFLCEYLIFSEERDKLKKTVFYLWPFFAIALCYLFVIKTVIGSLWGLMSTVKVSLPPRSFLSNILTQSGVSFLYIYLFVFPFQLCIDRQFPVFKDFSSLPGVLCFAGVVGLIIAAFFLRKRFKIISFSILWFFACLIPQFYARLNLVAAEHHPYLAFFGIYFLLAWFLTRVPIPKKILAYVFIFIFALFSMLTIIRNYEWRSEYTLWKAQLRINPDSAIAQGSIAVDLLSRGFVAEGMEYLRKSLSPKASAPTRVISTFNLAYYSALLGEPQKGIDILVKNREFLIKTHPFGYFKNLGIVLNIAGKKEEAKKAWEQALMINKNDADIKMFLGWWYIEQKSDFKSAEAYFRESLKINPDYAFAFIGLATVKEKEGKYPEAVTYYKRAISLFPENPDPYYQVGVIYAKHILSSEAEWYFKKTIELKPDFAPAYYNLCIFYLSLEQPDYKRAQENFNKAKELGYKVDSQIEEILRKNVNN